MTARLAALAALAVVALVSGTGRAAWTGGGKSEVRLEGDGNAWLVRVTLNGSVTGLFLVDTGASLCVVGPSTARRLALPPSGERVDIHTANGAVKAPLVRLQTVDVGGNRARDVPAVVHAAVPPPLAGILGLSYLNRFTYAIDPERRVLRLR